MKPQKAQLVVGMVSGSATCGFATVEAAERKRREICEAAARGQKQVQFETEVGSITLFCEKICIVSVHDNELAFEQALANEPYEHKQRRRFEELREKLESDEKSFGIQH